MSDRDNNINDLPKESMIKKSGFNNFMSRLFGWGRATSGNRVGNSSIGFSKVDIGSNERVGQALLNQRPNLSNTGNAKLEALFESWLSDNTDKMTDIQRRKERIDQIQYMVLNDPYVNRTVALYADEATQLDQQDTILSIETPDPRMTKTMYNLLNKWGLTQNRIRATIEQLAMYGDAFWANTVTENGVEAIKPLQQYQVTDRIEFNPIKALEMKKRREGSFMNSISNNYLINQMLDSFQDSGDFSDLFDTKLFGFYVDNDLVASPWNITHFRVNSDGSEFYPFGTSPILGALGPFKQTQSTITLQSLARVMSFPIQIFKVKTSDSMDEARQFGLVNRVRESFDNIGVSPSVGGSEVYSVNTKIWVPDGLLTIETHKPEIDTNNVDDIALYQDREATVLGLPKSFFGEEGWYSVGSSGKSLTQQYKPFARKVFSLQSAFIEGLADLFRIHFAITGEYDFRVPFTISMKFPSVENTTEYEDSRAKSIETANNVVELIKSAIGSSEDESLPPDIIRDIIAKYTFLDPVDIMKWTRDAKFNPIQSSSDEEGEEGGDFGGGDLGGDLGGGEDLGADLGGEDLGGDLGGGDLGESNRNKLLNRLREMDNRRLTESQRLREKELCDRYKSVKYKVYFESLKENAVNNFTRYNEHVEVFNQVDRTQSLMLETLSKNNKKSMILNEGLDEE